ncbi:hypothetical protein EJ03DRAFT_337355 [Teratosphaeria nubilosa]|uniref:Uncharacterized protein n=1 Tax=Teratosphaeria nubilosa TaxID=161662 RepID=A0A6G1L5E0_9PEZI|nr:hypothetical protein EJ03DRAFT_337355 [Teratosphaeria nubilosa]
MPSHHRANANAQVPSTERDSTPPTALTGNGIADDRATINNVHCLLAFMRAGEVTGQAAGAVIFTHVDQLLTSAYAASTRIRVPAALLQRLNYALLRTSVEHEAMAEGEASRDQPRGGRRARGPRSRRRVERDPGFQLEALEEAEAGTPLDQLGRTGRILHGLLGRAAGDFSALTAEEVDAGYEVLGELMCSSDESGGEEAEVRRAFRARWAMSDDAVRRRQEVREDGLEVIERVLGVYVPLTVEGRRLLGEMFVAPPEE